MERSEMKTLEEKILRSQKTLNFGMKANCNLFASTGRVETPKVSLQAVQELPKGHSEGAFGDRGDLEPFDYWSARLLRFARNDISRVFQQPDIL
jgi:hypothetical protein